MLLYRPLPICNVRQWWLSPGGCLNILIFYGKSVLFDNEQKTFLSTTLSRYFVRVHGCNPVPPWLKGREFELTLALSKVLKQVCLQARDPDLESG